VSAGGEIDAELAALLRNIADRIENGSAEMEDARILRRLARHAAGEDKRWTLKVHRGRGQPRLGAEGVEQRLAIARAVEAHRKKHGGNLSDAFRALSGKFGHASGPDKIKRAWQEMGPLLDLPEVDRKIHLFFRRLEASGAAKITRLRRGKK
jgi:hypothetical protein